MALSPTLLGVNVATDWAYHHVAWFHDGADAVGHTAGSGAGHVWNGVKDVGGGIKHVFSSVFQMACR